MLVCKRCAATISTPGIRARRRSPGTGFHGRTRNLSTMTFADNLAALPAIDHLAAIEVLDADGTVVDTVENKPGKSGSVKVYNHLAQVYGALTPEAASAGLTIFAEHTEDARANPGKHPNVDRLEQVLASGNPLGLRSVPSA